VFHTEAGVEIGVASTKAFTAQLTVLAKLAFRKNPELLSQLQNLPQVCENSLLLKPEIDQIAEEIKDRTNAIYLGRDNLYPIALEGALKLKEISYIHAEGFAAGEMKHGPIALIDDIVPVICLCPSGDMFDKMFSNIQVAQARGKNMIVFTDSIGARSFDESVKKVILPSINQELYPILYSIPLQLLAYTVTVLKGEDVDKPRNLAKSVTVE
jgi:glucosamine--fructose-6-phosphate aminotransferase (isomerizing)